MSDVKQWRQRFSTAANKGVPADLRRGDEVRAWCRIAEREKDRLVPFQGIVIRRRGSGTSETLTIRRITYGEGVERVIPLQAPVLDRIELLRRTKVRGARLYYLRRLVGKTRLADAQIQSPGVSSGSAAPKGAAEAPRAEEPAKV